MKLAIFNTLESAQSKLEELNQLAKTESSTEPFALTAIQESQDGSFFWFVYDPECLDNAGLGKGQILLKELELNILEVETIPSYFLKDTTSVIEEELTPAFNPDDLVIIPETTLMVKEDREQEE